MTGCLKFVSETVQHPGPPLLKDRVECIARTRMRTTVRPKHQARSIPDHSCIAPRLYTTTAQPARVPESSHTAAGKNERTTPGPQVRRDQETYKATTICAPISGSPEGRPDRLLRPVLGA